MKTGSLIVCLTWICLPCMAFLSESGDSLQVKYDSVFSQNNISAHKKYKITFNLSIRETFLTSDTNLRVYGVSVGVRLPHIHHFSIGLFYMPSHDSRNYQLVNSRLSPNGPAYDNLYLYFISFMYSPRLLETKRLEISFPLEAGIGLAERSTSTSLYDKVTQSTFDHTVKSPNNWFCPVQAGIYLMWKSTRWVGTHAQLGYRYIIWEEHNNRTTNYNGYYYGYGINLFLGNIISDIQEKKARPWIY